jgi:4-amino-4-deoxy-L-arabinose transferase-like glycosyltransferase
MNTRTYARTSPGTLLEDPAEIAPGEFESAANNARNLDGWLEKRLRWIALAALAGGFGFRVYAASLSYLNPDEALHYLLFHQPSLWLAYKAGLTNAHPPLIYLILYFWQFLGRSEFMLRLPSVLAGTGFCWLLYKWVSLQFGRAAGLAALILAAFSPTLISLSAQVRNYSVMLVCIASALYFLARAFESGSVRDMNCFSLALGLAILSNYSAAFFTLALGIYTLARIASSRPAWNFVAAWVGGQAGALAIYTFLYVTHISKINPSEMKLWAEPYDGTFYRIGHGSFLAFLGKNTAAIFRYFFLEDYLYMGLLLVFAASILLLLGNRFRSDNKTRATWPSGLLLLLPFAAAWAGALAGIYPYTGGRQTVFLVPFAIAGVSYVFAKISEQKLWAILAIAGLIALAGQTSNARFVRDMNDQNLSRTQMASAMKYIRQTVPRGDPLLVDTQSGILLRYYLCDPNDPYPEEIVTPGFTPFPCSEYSVVSTDDRTWKLTPENFVARFRDAAAAYRWRTGERVWVFQSGWGANLDTELSWYVMKYRCMATRNFGANITLIPFVVGTDLSPELPPGSPHLSSLHRCTQDP